MLTVIHTADWHLGHMFHGIDRTEEHAAFLAWLANLVEAEAADALIVAGDVFDTHNPSADAQRMLYGFLADLARRQPRLDVVLIAGNHDSSGRLEAPAPLLAALNVQVIGKLPRRPDGSLDPERLIRPLTTHDGAVAAQVAAVPFLRLEDLPRVPSSAAVLAHAAADAENTTLEDNILENVAALQIAAVRSIYQEALAYAAQQAAPDAAIIATGHFTCAGATLSEMSERRILIGGQHAIPVDVFASDNLASGRPAYVALGHLHRAQAVGGHHFVRYAGSPIPLALDEAPYPHQVVVARFEGPALKSVDTVRVPRLVTIHRVPQRGALPPDDLLLALAGLADEPELPPSRWPLVEAVAQLNAPDPGLRREVQAAMDQRALRLVKLTIVRPNDAPGGIAVVDTPSLADAVPAAIFARRYADFYGTPPPPAYVQAFDTLLDDVERGAEAADPVGGGDPGKALA